MSVKNVRLNPINIPISRPLSLNTRLQTLAGDYFSSSAANTTNTFQSVAVYSVRVNPNGSLTFADIVRRRINASTGVEIRPTRTARP